MEKQVAPEANFYNKLNCVSHKTIISLGINDIIFYGCFAHRITLFLPHPQIPMECRILAVSQRNREQLRGFPNFTKCINYLSSEYLWPIQ